MGKYQVIGNHTVAGVEPGGTVELPDEQAVSLIAGGHLAEKKAKPKPAKVDEPTGVDD